MDTENNGSSNGSGSGSSDSGSGSSNVQGSKSPVESPKLQKFSLAAYGVKSSITSSVMGTLRGPFCPKQSGTNGPYCCLKTGHQGACEYEVRASRLGESGRKPSRPSSKKLEKFLDMVEE